jgi:hypothetical protein
MDRIGRIKVKNSRFEISNFKSGILDLYPAHPC